MNETMAGKYKNKACILWKSIFLKALKKGNQKGITNIKLAITYNFVFLFQLHSKPFAHILDKA